MGLFNEKSGRFWPLSHPRSRLFLNPTDSEATELFELDDDTRLALVQATDLLAAFVKQAFVCDKINVASIGNLVSQLHMHVIGRRRDDFCWPGVAWGREEHADYTDGEVMEIVASLLANLDGRFAICDL